MRREAAAPIIQKLARLRPRCLGAVPAGSAAQPRAHWQSTCSAIVLGRSRPHAARLCAVRLPPATASLPSPLPPSMIGSGRGQQTRRRCRRASARPFARCSRRACAAYTVAQCVSSRPGTRSGQSLFPARVVGPPSCGVRADLCAFCVYFKSVLKPVRATILRPIQTLGCKDSPRARQQIGPRVCVGNEMVACRFGARLGRADCNVFRV